MSNENTNVKNIVDYAHTNTQTFDEMPFNNADGLVMTQLSRIKIDSSYGIDMKSGSSKTVAEIAAMYKSNGKPQGVGTKEYSNQVKLLDNMANNPRYKDLELSNFVENPVKEGQAGFTSVGSSKDAGIEQFAAVTVTYKQNGKSTHYMSFRSTDGTDNGWTEDMLMLSSDVTQAQLDAKNYMEKVAEKFPEGDLVGIGHSKGGNNFEYGFLTCKDSVRDRFSAGYLYDSPGLNPDIVKYNKQDYEKFQSLIKGHFLCPQDSVVGMLLHENRDASFVFSGSGDFFGEHDPYTWEIDPVTGSFTKKEQSNISKYVNTLLDVAVDRMPQEQREALYGFVYYIMKTYKNTNGNDSRDIDEILDNLKELVKGDSKMEKFQKLLPFFLDYWKTLTPEERQHFIQALSNIILALIITTEYYKIKDAQSWVKQHVNKMGLVLYSAAIVLRPHTDQRTGALDDIFRTVYQSFVTAISGITYGYGGSSSGGYVYSSENTYIELNTAAMRSYADRLYRVNQRIGDLDRRMDALYKQSGLRDLQKLIRADIMTGYSWHIVNCARYLEDTANDFDTVEREISSQF